MIVLPDGSHDDLFGVPRNLWHLFTKIIEVPYSGGNKRIDAIFLPLGLEIAGNIRKYRERKFPGRGGSKRAADAFGVTPQRWSPWENGSRSPDAERLQEIADFLGVTPDDLRELPLPPEPEKPAVENGVDGSDEMLELMGVLVHAQKEMAAGIRDRAGVAEKMREILRYAKYVLTDPAK